MSEHYDLVVIGSGPAGEKGAAQVAYYGKKVALVESAPHLGGAGINTGTVPSKTLRETALYFSGLRQRGLYGIDYSLKEGLTVDDFMYRKAIVIENERELIAANLDRHGIRVYWGQGALTSAHTVRVTTGQGADAQVNELEADVILLATGSHPRHPDGLPFDGRLVYDSDSILAMQRIPKSMVVIGGGIIGCEYASIFTALGVSVTLVERGDRLLPFVDEEIAGRLQTQLEQLGLRFLFNDTLTGVEPQGDHVRVPLKSGTVLEADVSLIAQGRLGNVQGLGLEAAGVKLTSRGLVEVNEQFQTSVPNIYAAGDVIGFPSLASVAMEQGRVAMVHAFNLVYKEHVSPIMPLSVYTIPEISMVGLSESDCQAKAVPHLSGRAYFVQNPRGQIIGEAHGMLKLVFSPDDKRLLGVHLIGELASELVHIGAHVMAANGTIDAFIQAVYNYPTLSDAYKYAAYDGLGQLDKWRQAQASGGEGA
jgi:NAD(P) transhydrogenase